MSATPSVGYPNFAEFGGGEDAETNLNYAFLSFQVSATTRIYNIITGVSLYGAVKKVPNPGTGKIYLLTEDFDAAKVTYTNQPASIGGISYSLGSDTPLGEYSEISPISGGNLGKTLATEHGIKISTPLGCYIYSATSNYPPYLSVITSDELVPGELYNLSPSEGYIDLAESNVFAFSFRQDSTYVSLEDQEVVSFVLQLRVHGQAAITSVNVSTWPGDTPNVTVPAGTISGESIDWRIVATTNAGQTVTSDWMTLEAEDSPPVAYALSPKSAVVDATKPTVFSWQHISSTGSAPTKAELQKSADGLTWETLATIDGSAREWVCPANTLTSSIKYWRVRTYNTDGVSSEWSEAAQIVVIAAPSAPSIQIKSTGPRPSISWQTSEQEAYQVELDGELSGGTHYGTDKTWQSPTYLTDGSHTVRVRVQNQYGMWSAWGAAALPVSNTPGEAITLTVSGGTNAELSWQSAGSYGFYLVYRDGTAIAKLTQMQYTDERSAGSVTYQVRGCYEDSDNYGLSNQVTVDVRPEALTVSDLDTGAVLRLPYSDSQHRQTGRTLSRQIELLQLSGAYYPVAVEVDAGTDALSVTAALTDESQVLQLMTLVGKLVCVKTPQGDMVIGYITSLPRQFDEFMHVFNFTVERIDYDDEVTL